MGDYRYLRLPFRINLAPEEFECKLQEKLDSLPGVIVLRDDILVVGNGETLDEANKNRDENLMWLLGQGSTSQSTSQQQQTTPSEA